MKGRNAEYNSEKIVEIFGEKLNEFSQSVALNTAGLIVADKESDFNKAFKIAANHLSSGHVFKAFKKNTIRPMTNMLKKL